MFSHLLYLGKTALYFAKYECKHSSNAKREGCIETLKFLNEKGNLIYFVERFQLTMRLKINLPFPLSPWLFLSFATEEYCQPCFI